MKENENKIVVDIGDYKALVGDQARLNAILDYISYMHDVGSTPESSVIMAIAGLTYEAVEIEKERKKRYEMFVAEKNQD